MKMLNAMKQMQRMKKIQKQLAAKTVEITSPDGTITVVARGDMTVRSVHIKPEALAGGMKQEKLERILVSTINGALDSSKKAAANDMAKFSGDLGGLSDLLGG
jgi:DNA-binding protein YbaB